LYFPAASGFSGVTIKVFWSPGAVSTWIDQGLGRPSMTFADLLNTVNDSSLRDEVAELLVLKRSADESAADPDCCVSI
jgi:predicted nucleotidyltransferase